ncbi:MAG: hydroxyphenylacetyl-CoA thioesterase PaaI [Nocardioidaceae bacterium]
MTPDELAQACADVMWKDDEASRQLGMTLDAVSLGAATLSMPVRNDMTNGHGTVHGGFIFALADSAFAFACNSHNERAVAQACDIVFAAPAHRGDHLVAVATERHRFGRNGIYDIRVTRDSADGAVIAEFRGRSRTIGGALVEATEDAGDAGDAHDPGPAR